MFGYDMFEDSGGWPVQEEVSCFYLIVCACVCICVRWLMHIKIWQKQLSPSSQPNAPEASKLVISQLLVVPTTVSATG